MPHQNTVFRQLTKRLPWGALDRLIGEHKADKGVRKLTTRDMLLTLVFAQVSEARSLRDIEALLVSQDARRYHSRLPAVHRSTLADATALRPAAVSDQIGFLSKRMAKSRRNPMSMAVREIKVTTDAGKVLRIFTNDLATPASKIAALYKRRWAIELFFRWIKQTLKLRHFYGTSENAVRIQIAVALIVFVLIKLAHGAQSGIDSLTRFGRLIRATVLHRRPLDRLAGATSGETGMVHNNAQMQLL